MTTHPLPPLFANAPGLARADGSATMHAAAAAIEPVSGTQRMAVLGFIVGKGGATDAECEAALGLPGSSVRPRRIELVAMGLIRDSGRTRSTPSGRKATVWVCIEGTK